MRFKSDTRDQKTSQNASYGVHKPCQLHVIYSTVHDFFSSPGHYSLSLNGKSDTNPLLDFFCVYGRKSSRFMNDMRTSKWQIFSYFKSPAFKQTLSCFAWKSAGQLYFRQLQWKPLVFCLQFKAHDWLFKSSQSEVDTAQPRSERGGSYSPVPKPLRSTTIACFL